jgi:UDP-2,3-diacylglucosamine hydrolase
VGGDPISGSPGDLGKVGIVAGGGDLPLKLADACRASGKEFYVVGIDGWAGEAIEAYDHGRIGLGQVGRGLKLLKDANCQSVVIAGYIKRPDFSKLKLDMVGAKLLPKVIAAARKGDDAIHTVLVEAFEAKGFVVVGAEAIFSDLLAETGSFGALVPDEVAKADIVRAANLIGALSPFDVGQGTIVCEGLVLAVEAAEGTDEMLQRCADLPEAIRGTGRVRRGVLVKIPKSGQERRVDLPTIGLRTVELAAEAGLAGIAIAAGGALFLDREEAIAAADTLGLFLIGFDPATDSRD